MNKKIDLTIFQNEMMVCSECGFKQRANPEISSGWYFLQIEGETSKYVCPACIPDCKDCKCLECDRFYDALSYKSCPHCELERGQPIPNRFESEG